MISAEIQKRNDFLYRIKCEYSEKTEVLRFSESRRLAKNRMIMSLLSSEEVTKEFTGE